MRVPRTTRRVAAALTAAMLAVLAPSGAAVSQPTSSAPGEDTFAKPPPLDPAYPVPQDDGQPDKPYALGTEGCVRSLNENTILPNKPWGQLRLRFEELHKFSKGAGQNVAVIDTGVAPHEFFQGRLSGGGDYVIPAEQGVKDCDGHGTEVAGIIAGNPNNPDIGFLGIAPEANIVSIRQSSSLYKGKDPNNPNAQEETAGNLRTLAKAIVNAAKRVPHGVINMSVDSCRDAGEITPAERDVQAALRFAVEQQDVVVVASAGNLQESAGCTQQNGPDPNRPSKIVTPPWFAEYVISVAALEESGTAAQFSMQGPWVSVAAPGTNIISLDPGNLTGLANRTVTKDRKLNTINGTSFAAPYVAGLAALVRDRFKQLNAKQVMHRIKSTASHPAATAGRDNLVGSGMINPVGALTAMIPGEHGIPGDEAADVNLDIPPPFERDWTPVRVAVIGSAGGLGLLLLTLFVVHTVRRNRRDPAEGARGSA